MVSKTVPVVKTSESEKDEKESLIEKDRKVLLDSIEITLKRYPYITSWTQMTDHVSGTVQIRILLSKD